MEKIKQALTSVLILLFTIRFLSSMLGLPGHLAMGATDDVMPFAFPINFDDRTGIGYPYIVTFSKTLGKSQLFYKDSEYHFKSIKLHCRSNDIDTVICNSPSSDIDFEVELTTKLGKVFDSVRVTHRVTLKSSGFYIGECIQTFSRNSGW